jgi:mono/diheme cytochrome c family protein
MVVGRAVQFGVLILGACVAEGQDKPAVAKGPMLRTIAASGKQTYMQYCASCHGIDARGEGPAAFVLKTPPPDLTTLAKRHDGKFPFQYVSDVLRFGTRILSHGSSDMPIWGPSLAPWTTTTNLPRESALRISATTWRLCSKRSRRASTAGNNRAGDGGTCASHQVEAWR